MICMMNVPYVVLKYATLLLSFPVNNVVEVVLTTLTAVLKSTNKSSFFSFFFTRNKTNSNNTKNENSFYKYTKTPKQQQIYSNITLFSLFIIFWL